MSRSSPFMGTLDQEKKGVTMRVFEMAELRFEYKCQLCSANVLEYRQLLE